jgi:hypothetical protein
MSKPQEIDAIYLWADGSDPQFSASLLECKDSYFAAHGRPPDPESIGVNRFRDMDNLRYSLRSLEKNAPWFRRIFLVTNGQVPTWLRENDRIQIVTVDEIVPDQRDLPTFNATSIEWSLHRIPGLSRYYIFMNDDYFFAQFTKPEYFFGENGRPRLLFSPSVIKHRPDSESLWNRMLANQAKLLSTQFGFREWYRPAHGPFFFDNVELSRIRSLWPEQIKETTRHRFRDETDLHMQILYVNALAALDQEKDPAQRHETAVLYRDQLRFISVGNPAMPWQAQLRETLKRPSRFLCLNDDGPPGNIEEIERAHRKFLEKLFPKPSSFEAERISGAWSLVRRMFARA